MITHKTLTESVVISKRLDLRRRRLRLLRRRKYFWAWLATCVGVLVFTKFLEIPLQSPFPTFCRPNRNSLCSSSVHGTPICCSVTTKSKILILLYNKFEITILEVLICFKNSTKHNGLITKHKLYNIPNYSSFHQHLNRLNTQISTLYISNHHHHTYKICTKN